ncbi:MAG: hypothetical protein ACI837_000029 [Crocinitomicaceae bacterium]|jgi:hypothetical protein
MKQFLVVSVYALILTSCGTSSTFSKRKHLPGHFWNKVDKHKAEKSAKQDDSYKLVYAESSSDGNHTSENETFVKKEETSLEPQDEVALSTRSEENDPLVDQNDNLSNLESSESSAPDEKEETLENKSMSVTQASRLSFWEDFLIASFFICFFVGVIFIILWVILHFFGSVGIWMLITGSIMAGIPLLIALIIFIVVMIAMRTKPLPRNRIFTLN